jgi:hypothetical protein
MSKPKTDPTTPLWAEWTKLGAIISLLESDGRDESMVVVLDALGDAISAAGRRTHEAVRSGDEQYADAVIDRECAIVESLLGAAFIVCQTKITAIIAGAYDARICLDPLRRSMLPFKDKALSVLEVGATLGSTGYSAVAAINEVANYFKHHEEWDGVSWEPNKRNEKTIPVIRALGLKPLSTGNLRRAAKAFGWKWDERGSLHVLDRAIAEWAELVVEAIRKASVPV